MKKNFWKKECSKDCVNYVILAVIVIILSLLKLYSSPIRNDLPEIDSSVFQIMGKGLLNNQTIYKDLFDHKGPVVYVINAIAYIINPNIGLFIVETTILYIGLIFIYKTSRMFLSEKLSMISSLVYLIPIFAYLDGGNYTEEYAITFTNIAIYNILKIFFKNEYDKKSNWIIIGTTFAINLMIKPTYIAVWIAFGIIQLIYSIKEKKVKELLKYILYMICGILIIIVPVLLYLIIKNDINSFLDAYILMNMKYSKTTIYNKIMSFSKLLEIYHGYIYVFVVLAGSLMIILNKKIEWKIKDFVLLFNIMTLILASWAANLYQHYLIQISPAVAISLVFLLNYINEEIIKRDKIKEITKQMPISFIYFCTIIALTWIAISYNSIISIKYLKTRHLYNEYKKNNILEINQYLDEKDELFVLGNDESCYILLNKQPRFKHFFQTPIFVYNREIIKETEEYIKENKPKVIVKKTTNNNKLFDDECQGITEILDNDYNRYDKKILTYYVLKDEAK